MAGQAVAFTTENEVDIARGDLVLELQSQKYPNNRFLAELVWMNEKPAARGRSYLLISNSQKTIATITTVRDKTDAETGHKQTTRDLKFNEIGTVELATNSPVIFDSYSELRETGSFLLVDRSTNETLAAGMVLHEMRRGKNVHEQTFAIARMNRENQKGHRGQVIWLTGLSGSGKSTIASRLETELHNQGFHTYILDGDNLRLGINKDLGFNSQDRAENVRRVGEIAKLMLDAGLVIIVCLVSPYRGDRDSVRSNFGGDDFIEVYVDTPLEICMERDPKNLYAKANNGEIPNMTGIGQEYEPPLDPEVTVSGTEAIEVSISRILPLITNRKEIL
jgi:bifunctional enzyme CysN/CysC